MTRPKFCERLLAPNNRKRMLGAEANILDTVDKLAGNIFLANPALDPRMAYEYAVDMVMYRLWIRAELWPELIDELEAPP